MEETSAQPLASIVILFMDGSPWIERCLASLRQHIPDSLPHEVVVLANGVASETDMARADGVRLLRSGLNLGFGPGCNWAARHARGKYLVFLNDDTYVTTGWLESLVDTAERDPRTGAVSSLVVAPDGRIAEAGRVLWRDGSSDGIAGGLRASEHRLPRLREVDSASGCSLLVRRHAWDEVGGFDERYFPAYYEDADLCLGLRAAGWAVVSATTSRVFHERSASTSLLWRRFLGLRNHRLFADKWAEALPVFDPKPRDRPTVREVERAARGAENRRQAVRATVQQRPRTVSRAPSEVERSQMSDEIELLQRQLRTLEAELHVKDEYLAFLEQNRESWERGLQRSLDAERRRAALRDRIRRIPLLGRLLVYLKRRRGTPSSKQS